jgi:inosine/xanthosine triphosphatase
MRTTTDREDTMIRIVLASDNPVKVQASLSGFRKMFPEQEFFLETVPVSSGVPDQPMSDAETLQGALERADGAAQAAPDADFWVGIEGGVEDIAGSEMTAFAWVVIKSRVMVGKGRTGTFFLPTVVADLVRDGKELGDADDIVFGRSNSKQEEGAIGLLTGKVIDRMGLYEHAVILALVPFRNASMYTA